VAPILYGGCYYRLAKGHLTLSNLSENSACTRVRDKIVVLLRLKIDFLNLLFSSLSAIDLC